MSSERRHDEEIASAHGEAQKINFCFNNHSFISLLRGHDIPLFMVKKPVKMVVFILLVDIKMIRSAPETECTVTYAVRREQDWNAIQCWCVVKTFCCFRFTQKLDICCFVHERNDVAPHSGTTIISRCSLPALMAGVPKYVIFSIKFAMFTQPLLDSLLV